jgi:hypothetical protein
MRRILAVAQNTIRQAVRLKIAVVFFLILIILLPIMGTVMTGDGTLTGRCQTFIAYSLSLTSLLLCVFTIIISIFTLADDINKKQIFTVVTKPIRKSELIIGKFLGVLITDVVLLTICAAVIYAVVTMMPRFTNASEIEKTIANNRFFTARTKLIPPEPDVTAEVEAEYKKLEAKSLLPDNISKKRVIAQLTARKKIEKRSADVSHDIIWEFENVKPLNPWQSIFIKFKYEVAVTPPDAMIYGQWFVGDYRQLVSGQMPKDEVYFYNRKDAVRTVQEIEVPANAIAPDGYLAVGFNNPVLNNSVVIFPPEAGLEVLYRSGSFLSNYIKSIILILVRLIFLAALGILCATFLSFPVAMLVCLVVYCSGSISGFVNESLSKLGENVGFVYAYTIKPLLSLMPQLDKLNPAKYLVPAEVLHWSTIAEVFTFTVVIKAFLLILIALIVFSYREVAKIQN